MCNKCFDTAVVVDDDRHFLESVGLMLRRIGFRDIKLFVDAHDALDWLEEGNSNLIVSDLDMPVMNGCEFLQEVRAKPTTVDTPFILNTGNLMPEYRQAAITSGASEYLFKPYKLDELKEKVLAIVDCAEGAQGPQAQTA
jgi:two-component system chemotaxis response regulator CheY